VTDDRGGRSVVSRTITVTPASIDVSSATLTDDGDGRVTPGDSVTVAVTIDTVASAVDTVTANVDGFDAGSISLSDDAGTYEGTFTVGSDPDDGARTATIEIHSTAGNTTTVETNSLIVDSVPPIISETSLSDALLRSTLLMARCLAVLVCIERTLIRSKRHSGRRS